MKNRRLLVTGGSGFLGRRVVGRASDFETVLAGSWSHGERCESSPRIQVTALDLGEEEAERHIVELAPTAIVHTAAVNPGGPEDRMEAVNVRGTAAVARAAARLGCRLVHVSTDVVHNGNEAPYADDAPPKPMWIYGRTKAEGEAAVKRLYPDAVIVRTSLIYGLNEVDRVTAGFIERLQEGETLTLFTDQIRQPIWVETLATVLLELLQLNVSGYLNIAGDQALTRNEIAQRLLDFWDAPEGKIELVRSADLGIQRPRDLRLDLRQALNLLQTPLPGMDAVLAHIKEPSNTSI
ncbi:MAG: sugar nucleotide-binding protein [Deltaproteobacteria bacterium]|nr:sugar nucleotide-binding protein [Deltaproteobacteria bacterium]